MEGINNLIFDEVVVNGSSRGNVEAIACVYFFQGEIVHQESKSMIGKNCTTPRAQLKAVIEAMTKSQGLEQVLILSDCKYCVYSHDYWLDKWPKRNWKTRKGEEVKNIPEMQTILTLRKEEIRLLLVPKEYVSRARALCINEFEERKINEREEVEQEEMLEDLPEERLEKEEANKNEAKNKKIKDEPIETKKYLLWKAKYEENDLETLSKDQLLKLFKKKEAISKEIQLKMNIVIEMMAELRELMDQIKL